MSKRCNFTINASDYGDFENEVIQVSHFLQLMRIFTPSEDISIVSVKSNFSFL